MLSNATQRLDPLDDADDVRGFLREQDEARARKALMPTKQEMIDAFGLDALTDNPDGSWSFAIVRPWMSEEQKKQRWGLYREMCRTAWKKDDEHSRNLGETKAGKLTVYGPEGDAREIMEEQEPGVADKSRRLQREGKEGFHFFPGTSIIRP